jgi:hypothetical protein
VGDLKERTRKKVEGFACISNTFVIFVFLVSGLFSLPILLLFSKFCDVVVTDVLRHTAIDAVY